MNSGLGIGEQSSRDYKTVVRPLFSFLAEIIKPWSVPYFPGLSPIFLFSAFENRGLSPIFPRKPWSVPYFLRADQETTARHKNLIDTSIR